MEASYTKLKQGGWGVRVTGGAVAGLSKGAKTKVLVTKKSGETKIEMTKVIWIGDNRYGDGKVALCSIVRDFRDSGNGNGGGGDYRPERPGYCSECGCNIGSNYDSRLCDPDGTICYDCM